jgi:hypothetical protein
MPQRVELKDVATAALPQGCDVSGVRKRPQQEAQSQLLGEPRQAAELKALHDFCMDHRAVLV